MALSVALLASVWIVIVLVELTLAVYLHKSVLREEILPLWMRVTLFCLNLCFIAIAVGLLGGPLVLIPRLRWYLRITRYRGIRWIAQGLIGLALWLVFFLYFSSWGVFFALGFFLDSEGIAFWSMNPLQFFQHIIDMEPSVMIIVPAIAFTMAMILYAEMPRLLKWMRPALVRRIPLVTGGALGVCLIIAFSGELIARSAKDSIRHPTLGGMIQIDEYYSFSRDYRAGPVTRLLMEMGGIIRKNTEEPYASGNIGITRRPIIPMQKFIAEVPAERIKKWSMLIIIVESLRPDQLRAFGCPRDVMPTVDSLAQEARIFRRCRTQATDSALADLCPISSHYPLRYISQRPYVENPPYPRVLIHDILKPLGYKTAIFSSQNENWMGMFNYLNTGSLDLFFHSENFKGPKYIPAKDQVFSEWAITNKRAGKIDDRLTVREAINWIEGLDGEPFFIYMNLQNSHIPYNTPDDFPRPFGPEKIDFPLFLGYFPADKLNTVKDIYADSLAYIDFQLKRLFERLKARGLWDRMVLVVTSDTGQAFYEHGFVAHGNWLYEELVHVPLLIRAPGLEPGYDDRIVQHIDIPPMVLGLLGIPPHPSFQGIDAISKEPSPDRPIYLVSQTPAADQCGIVQSGWKLIADKRLKRHVLFNLERDPAESMDLSAAHPKLVHKLATRLHAWRRAQLVYYADENLYRTTYPPILQE